MRIINIKGYGNIDMDKYTSLKECMLSTIDSHDENGNDIMSDSDWEFADQELAEYWYEYKGFTREDIKYIYDRGLEDLWSDENRDWDEVGKVLRNIETIYEFMDPDLREQVHRELTPCTDEEFLRRYCELDPSFRALLESEFGIKEVFA